MFSKCDHCEQVGHQHQAEHQLPQPGADNLPAGGGAHARVSAVGRLGRGEPHPV